MNLGFVGVGKWAQRLAAAFRACGAETVHFDRGTNQPSTLPEAARAGAKAQADHEYVNGFGYRMYWPAMIADKSIDAIIAVAPPEVTTEVALACAAAGKPVMATKPLFDHPETIRAPFYVDFWRLWSEAHRELRRITDSPEWPPDPNNEIHWRLCGSGPFRSFPEIFDYGPHVMAAIQDLMPLYSWSDPWICESHNGGQTFAIKGSGRGLGYWNFRASFGNGTAVPSRKFFLPGKLVCVEEATRIGTEEKSAVLQRFCQSFLNDIHEGFVDTRLLELSRRGMQELRKIREMATRGD
jgi:hypothetical protein